MRAEGPGSEPHRPSTRHWPTPGATGPNRGERETRTKRNKLMDEQRGEEKDRGGRSKERRESESEKGGPVRRRVFVTCFQTTTVSLVVYYSADRAVTLEARPPAARGERTRGRIEPCAEPTSACCHDELKDALEDTQKVEQNNFAVQSVSFVPRRPTSSFNLTGQP